MQLPGVAIDIQCLGDVHAHGSGDAVPANAESCAFPELGTTPIVECITHIKKCGGGPILAKTPFDFSAASHNVVGTDAVIAQVFESITPHTAAATGFEAV